MYKTIRIKFPDFDEEKEGLSLLHFSYFHVYAIRQGRVREIWEMLETFGYNSDFEYKPEFTNPFKYVL